VGAINAKAGLDALHNVQMAGNGSGDWKYIPPPKGNPPAFTELKRANAKTPVQGGGGLRRRWVDDKGRIYEWDSQHGTLEKYTKNGKHLGEFDPTTGEQLKPPDPAREVQK